MHLGEQQERLRQLKCAVLSGASNCPPGRVSLLSSKCHQFFQLRQLPFPSPPSPVGCGCFPELRARESPAYLAPAFQAGSSRVPDTHSSRSCELQLDRGFTRKHSPPHDLGDACAAGAPWAHHSGQPHATLSPTPYKEPVSIPLLLPQTGLVAQRSPIHPPSTPDCSPCPLPAPPQPVRARGRLSHLFTVLELLPEPVKHF